MHRYVFMYTNLFHGAQNKSKNSYHINLEIIGKRFM